MFFTLTNVLKKKKNGSAQEKCMQNYEFWLNKLAKKKVKNTINVTIFSQYLYFSYGGPWYDLL